MSRPKIVIDTNVLVSAAIKPGSLEEAVLMLVADGRCELAFSSEIYGEYDDVLHRPRLRLAPERIDSFLQLMCDAGTLVRKAPKLSACPDGSDNRFLECAEAAGANYLVTGNKRHFPKTWKATRIVSARELLQLLKLL